MNANNKPSCFKAKESKVIKLNGKFLRAYRWIAFSVFLVSPMPIFAEQKISIQVRDTNLSEVIEMIAAQQRINI